MSKKRLARKRRIPHVQGAPTISASVKYDPAMIEVLRAEALVRLLQGIRNGDLDQLAARPADPTSVLGRYQGDMKEWWESICLDELAGTVLSLSIEVEKAIVSRKAVA